MQRHSKILRNFLSTDSTSLSKKGISHHALSASISNSQENAILRKPPSLATNDRIAIYPPPDASPPPPAWMLKYFPSFFVVEQQVGPEEHNQPFGVVGVYGYIVTLVITSCLLVGHIRERFFTDQRLQAKSAVLELKVRDEIKRFQEEEKKRNRDVLV